MIQKIKRKLSIFILVLIAATGITFYLFNLWPFTLIFFIVGGIATLAINFATGYTVNYFLVILAEFVILVIIMAVAPCFMGGKHA